MKALKATLGFEGTLNGEVFFLFFLFFPPHFLFSRLQLGDLVLLAMPPYKC
jgi:hypothetical protein